MRSVTALFALLLLSLLACREAIGDDPAPAAASAAAAPGPRHVILIVPDGMTRANEAGLSWYLHGQEQGDFSLSFHGWPLHVPVTTWDVSTYNKYAGEGREFDPAAFDPAFGYDPARGGSWPALHSDAATDPYFLHGQAGPDVKGAQPATDSAAAATAMATGVKVKAGVLSYDTARDAPLMNIAELLRAQRPGRAGVGMVSTVPITHATPAGFSAHDGKRGNYHDIAHDQLSALPDVLAGGGHPLFDKDHLAGKAPKYMMLEQYEWLKAHPALAFAERRADTDGGAALQAAAEAARAGDLPLVGLFGNASGCMNEIAADPNQPDGFDYGTPENPDCWELTRAALEVLSDAERFPDGFFLLVEQGDLDWANHGGNWAYGLGCMRDTNTAAANLVAWIEAGEGHGLTMDNTLVLLVADHAHYHRVSPDFKPGAGELPAGAAERAEPAAADEYQRRIGPDGAVQYSRALYHSNELVMLYAWGADGADGLAQLAAPYIDRGYRGLPAVPGAIDNTAVFNIMRDWLRLNPAE